MTPVGILFLLFAVMPIVEIALLINVGEMIGGWNTVGIVIATAFIGAFLVKKEGVSTLSAAQAKMQQGIPPGDEMAQGLLLLVAGVLLVTPGFVTDIIGLLFTLPPTRKMFAKVLLAKLAVRVQSQAGSPFQGGAGFHAQYQYQSKSPSTDDDIIEGEFRDNTVRDDKLIDGNSDRRE